MRTFLENGYHFSLELEASLYICILQILATGQSSQGIAWNMQIYKPAAEMCFFNSCYKNHNSSFRRRPESMLTNLYQAEKWTPAFAGVT
jgi:hypothetical protein